MLYPKFVTVQRQVGEGEFEEWHDITINLDAIETIEKANYGYCVSFTGNRIGLWLDKKNSELLLAAVAQYAVAEGYLQQ